MQRVRNIKATTTNFNKKRRTRKAKLTRRNEQQFAAKLPTLPSAL